jgi:NitT/TauT family transport system substrate-binding protein
MSMILVGQNQNYHIMSFQKIFSATIIFIIAISGFSLYLGQKQSEGKGYVNPKTKVRIGIVTVSTSLPIKVAEKKNLFSKYDIEPVVTEVQTSNQLTDALVRGEIDMGYGAGILPPIDSEISSPGKLKLFSVNIESPQIAWNAIITKKESSIQNLNDLAGKKIGVFPGMLGQSLLKEYLKTQKVDTSKIEFVQIPPANQLAAIEASSVDVLFTYDPLITMATESGKYKIIDSSIYAKQNSNAAIASAYVSTNFINYNKSIADKAIKATEEANFMIQNRDESIDQILIDWQKLDPTIAKKIALSPFYSNKDMDTQKLQSFVDFMTSVSLVKQKVNINDMFYRAE